MVRVNETRIGISVISETVDQAKLTKQGAEVAVASTGASARVNLTRCSISVIRATPRVAKLTKQGAEVAIRAEQASTSGASLTRNTISVLSATLKRGKMTKQGAEVAVRSGQASNAPVALTRSSISIIARRGPDVVIPIPLTTGAEFLLHNWASELEIENAYETAISISATEGAEERCGILLKPERTLTFKWSRSGQVDVDKVFRFLERATRAQLPFPLYSDATDVTTFASATAGNATVLLNTTESRFFNGARVALLRLDHAYQIVSSEFYEILSRTGASLTFSTPLVADVPAGSIVVPMIDCEIVLEPQATETHGQLVEVSLSVLEVAGRSQLPAISTGSPDGFSTYQGFPIFNVDPNWGSPVAHSYSRQGQSYKRGRKTVVYATAERARGTEKYGISCNRTVAWGVLRFFDSRRGRLRTFFQVDQDYLWTVQSAAGVFIEINKLGDFTEFQIALNPGWIGIVMEDGTAVVREVVTVQDLPSSWRITVLDALPTIATPQIVRAARARKVRLASDALTEKWLHTGLFSTDWETLEALKEQDETT